MRVTECGKVEQGEVEGNLGMTRTCGGWVRWNVRERVL